MLLTHPAACWLLASVGLLIMEGLFTTSVALLFGVAAGIVGIAVLVAGSVLTPMWQITLFAVMSAILLATCLKAARQVLGQAAATTGDMRHDIANAPSGQVSKINEPSSMKWGVVDLEHEFLGSSKWMFTSDTPVSVGDRVRIVGINGNIAQVKKEAE